MEGKDNELIRRGEVREAFSDELYSVFGIDDSFVDNITDSIPDVPQEMTAREFAESIKRMCTGFEVQCRERKCPLYEWDDDGENPFFHCDPYTWEPEKVVSIVEQWAKEHPEPKPADKPITYADIFFTIHQNAVGKEDGVPSVCRGLIFNTPCAKNYDCEKCWNEPYPEPID